MPTPWRAWDRYHVLARLQIQSITCMQRRSYGVCVASKYMVLICNNKKTYLRMDALRLISSLARPKPFQACSSPRGPRLWAHDTPGPQQPIERPDAWLPNSNPSRVHSSDRDLEQCSHGVSPPPCAVSTLSDRLIFTGIELQVHDVMTNCDGDRRIEIRLSSSAVI